jgi:hypothetical protein
LYSFSSLPVGNYTITVEKQGFKTLQKTSNALQVGEPLTVDGTLEIGQVSETVTVMTCRALQNSNATIGNVIEQKAIEALPLNGAIRLRSCCSNRVLCNAVWRYWFGRARNGARDRATT